MNIMIGKFGRSLPFNPESWSMFRGDDLSSQIFLEIARAHPEHTFYLVGSSDFSKYKEECDSPFSDVKLPDNIVDVFVPAKKELGEQFCFTRVGNKSGYDLLYKEPGKEPWRMVEKYVADHNIIFDAAIIIQGPDARASIMGEGIKCKTKEGTIQCLSMAALYNAPIRHILNRTMIPWVNIVEDPRYIPTSDVDAINREIVNLSFCNKDVKRNFMEYYTQDPKDYPEFDVKYRYIDMVKFFMTRKTKYDFSSGEVTVGKKTYKKDLGMILACNDGAGRLGILEKWVLNFKPDIKIYGKWKDEAKEKYPNTFVEKAMAQMQETMWRSKYAFIPAFDKKSAFFVTPKPWEMIYFGILPFWDKNGYDVDNIYKEIPDYLKVETPEEMWQKIEFLDNNPEEYKKLLKQIYDLLDDKYFKKEYINEVFNPVISMLETAAKRSNQAT